jgi:hypothetical protein
MRSIPRAIGLHSQSHAFFETLGSCARFPKLDDQTNLFDELRENWLSSSSAKGRGMGVKSPRAVQCSGGESDAHPIGGAYSWPVAAAGSRSGSNRGREDEDSDGAGSPLRTCPLPRLPFATGFAHRDVATWRAALASHGTPPVLLHFNCLGRGGGHDSKRRTMEATAGAWVWGDGRVGGDGSTGPPLTPSAGDGTCLPFTAA